MCIHLLSEAGIQIMLKILVYIYNQSVRYHGHKYIKLGKQNKRMRRGEPEGGKNGNQKWAMGGRWKWKHRGGHNKRRQEAAEEGRDEERCFPRCSIPNRDCSDSSDW